MSLSQSIKQAQEIGIWLHEKTNDRNFSGGVRERTAGAILQLALDHDDAILVLLNAKLPGPALALARPLFESYVRGVWLLRFASIDDIQKFNNGTCPSFYNLSVTIGNDEETGGAWIRANKDSNLNSFHNLTHGGSEHVNRRVNQDTIEPNYPEQELEALVRFGTEIRIRIGAELLLLLNDELAMEQLDEKSRSFRM